MTDQRDTRMPPAACPNCEKVLDGAWSVFGPATPAPGDYTICAYCRVPCRYTDDMRLRRITLMELAELVDLILRGRQAKAKETPTT